MTMTTELTELKQEVAELWAKYRKEEPRVIEDESRRELAALNRTLETKRRALSDRSSSLRLELEAHRRRASRLSPVVRVFGGIIGAALSSALVIVLAPEFAQSAISFSAGQGVVLICASLLLTGLCVSRVGR
jgi:hypothetical protein